MWGCWWRGRTCLAAGSVGDGPREVCASWWRCHDLRPAAAGGCGFCPGCPGLPESSTAEVPRDEVLWVGSCWLAAPIRLRPCGIVAGGAIDRISSLGAGWRAGIGGCARVDGLLGSGRCICRRPGSFARSAVRWPGAFTSPIKARVSGGRRWCFARRWRRLGGSHSRCSTWNRSRGPRTVVEGRRRWESWSRARADRSGS